MQNMRNPKIKKGKKTNKNLSILFWVFLIFLLFSILNTSSLNLGIPTTELTYSEFYSMLKDNSQTGRIQSIVKTENILTGQFSDGSRFSVSIPGEDKDLIPSLRENVTDFTVKPPRTFLITLLFNLCRPIYLS